MIVNHVTSVAVDQEDNIWFTNGNSNLGGIMKFNQSTDDWTLFTPNNSSLPTGIINTIHVDNNGTIWTCHGMFAGKGGIWNMTTSGIEENYTTDNSDLNYNWISHINSDQSGKIWIGSNIPILLDGETLFGGIQEFDIELFKNHNPSNSGYNTNRVESMEFDEVGNLWVSTGLDAPVFDLKNEVSIYNKSDWLVLSQELTDFPQYRITDIKFHDESLWMATALGLLNVNLKYE